MQTRSSPRNLKAEKETKTESIPEMESWQRKILTVRGLEQSCWLVDSIVDVHVCNNKKLIIDFTENSTKVRRSSFDDISLGRRKVKIRLVLKDATKRLVFILTNIFYLPNNSSNLVTLGFLNNVGIYHHNKDSIFYNYETQKTLAFTEQYKISFFLYPLNLSAAAVNLHKNRKIYEEKIPNINQTKTEKLSLIRWHQHLGHLNFIS